MKTQPSIYLTHGGGPCFWMEYPPPLGPHAYELLKVWLSQLLESLPERPKAILMVTAHWEESLVTVSTAKSPPMLFDYYGFPPHTYQLRYPAPGAPEIASRARDLLEKAHLPAGTNSERGFDHGVFVPMLIVDPAASIPLAMVSMQQDLDPAFHIAVGAALAPLRQEGILIIGSGSSFHNLRTIRDGEDDSSRAFDDWLNETITVPDPLKRAERLKRWSSAPGALACHPRPDHLIPLMVATGAAQEDPGVAAFRDLIGGKAYSCFRFDSG